ncbi:RNA 2',3'-cyclic phosphodiesterase [Saccharopolyspora sp. NFXS83]|uniref:RNA 2',3'-cyclic phosphodiesterase n=1 Tax=Saccharopolyspora sp. NFXS83 TaxID=2993560 RepID=UPI00224A9137|nr:RNA 2',3'-cyclic phosphodiesterase [Saccharopolyspora sp. NFXS83]MCX2732945.1 RNA 2',3'-cyclic phosphodiesterase [Saccharopolyspora sp. NFXS83]
MRRIGDEPGLPRLFTAVWPPREAIDHLLGVLDETGLERAGAGLRRFRLVPSRQWHLTLCFHGPADPAARAALLDDRVPEATAPRLRLAGAGTFRGVLWAGVEPAADSDARALRALVLAAGGDPDGFRAHLTLARWNAGRPDRRALLARLGDCAGPWWDASEVALVRSDQEPAGSVYRTVHSVAVPRRAAGEQGGRGSP